MNLFIDTTNWNLALVLEKNGEIIDQFVQRGTKKISDFFVAEVTKLLEKNHLTIKEIQNLYVTTGPGSYTGVRIGLLFVRTLKTIDNHYQTYVINSLAFQAGMESAISLLDARGGNFFVGVYKDGQPQIKEQLMNQDELEKIVKNYNFPILKDDENLDFAANFLTLKKHFQLVNNYENLNPLYLKPTI